MLEFFSLDKLPDLFFGILVLLLGVQIYILMRIRAILRVIARNLETISSLFRKSLQFDRKEPRRREIPPICQFCKHRLAYIYSNKNENQVEDIYYKCGLRNIHVSLSDSCERFEVDDVYLD